MSTGLLFALGAAVFIVVLTALFQYGLACFAGWQRNDDSPAGHEAYPQPATVRVVSRLQRR